MSPSLCLQIQRKLCRKLLDGFERAQPIELDDDVGCPFVQRLALLVEVFERATLMDDDATVEQIRLKTTRYLVKAQVEEDNRAKRP